MKIAKKDYKKSITNDILFKKEVFSFDYPQETLEEFYKYWSEPIKTGKIRKDLKKKWCTEKSLKSWSEHFSVKKDFGPIGPINAYTTNYRSKIKTKGEALYAILALSFLIAIIVSPKLVPYLITTPLIVVSIYDIYSIIKQYKRSNKEEKPSLLNDEMNDFKGDNIFFGGY